MENNLKIAVFKSDSDDFEKYYNKKMVEQGCIVYPLGDFCAQAKIGKKGRFEIDKILALDLSEYDIIVVFEWFKIIPFIKMKMKSRSKLILWNWNIQNAKNVFKEKLVSPFCEIWTFDKNDAEKYGWKHNNQFYIPNVVSHSNEKRQKLKAFCACIDKKRYQTLKEIRKCLQENNVECDFCLVKDGTSDYQLKDNPWISDKGMPYSDFLEHTMECDIIVDIVQSGQNGLTVRVLEALFYNKKMITNNVDVKKYPFYNKKNIYIWMKEDNHSDIKLFLQDSNYYNIDKNLKEAFCFKEWINKFFKG